MESSRGHIHAVEEPRASTPQADPTPFLDALREAADYESKKEELVGGKTRGIVTVTAAYFAVVQTASFASAALGPLTGAGKTLTVAFSVGAIAFLAVAIAFAVAQQWPREHRSLPFEKIGQDLTDLLNGKTSQREAVHELARNYAEVAETRTTANNQRLGLYYATAAFCLSTAAMTTAELAVSLLSRL
jgi:hypothetical protein